jgi:hypothetical protein
MGELLADKNRLFILWLIAQGKLSSRATLATLFKGTAAEQSIEELLQDGFISENNSTLQLRLEGQRVLKTIGRPRVKRRVAGRPPAAAASAARTSSRSLESLEEAIDDCLQAAKGLDRQGLADVIALLRRARNEVVWKLGDR